MNVIEYKDIYENDVKNLLNELQDYIVSLDPYHYNIKNEGYKDKVFEIDMDKVENNNGKVYLAIDDNKVIGLIMGIIEEPIHEYDFERPDSVGNVIELIVTKNTRSKGVGKALLQKMEEYFKNNDCKTVNIDVFGYNDLGQQFYFKNGYHTRMMTVSKML